MNYNIKSPVQLKIYILLIIIVIIKSLSFSSNLAKKNFDKLSPEVIISFPVKSLMFFIRVVTVGSYKSIPHL